ncbi:MAG TPA: MFS transporter [Candidatus Limnocylindrales bacterium]|nr:MFS transporter [Candidatus Limnocylindrales bacterium]
MATFRPAERARIPGKLLIVIVLLAISVFINYIDRGNLSIAAPMLKDELGISAAQLGLLLSAFFWTYACLHLFYGWVVDRLNVNWVFAFAFLLWSAATALTGIVHTFAALFVLRLLLGMGEAASYPSYNKIIALNFEEKHRGVANSVLASGLLLGPGFGMLFGGLLMARFGWRPFFIVLGLGSMLWILPWLKWMPQKQYAKQIETTGAPNLIEFLLLRSAWGTCIGLFCGNYVNYFLITWLPFNLVRERHFSMDKMARIGGLAYLLASLACTLSGWLSDRWIAAGATPSLVRKAFTGGGVGLSGIFLGLAVVSGPTLCVALVILGVTAFGVSASNIWAITQTLAGLRATGRWAGFQSFFGNMSGMVAPAVTGYVLQRTGHFFWAFIILVGVAFAGATSWILLVGRVEPVTWGRKLRVAATTF